MHLYTSDIRTSAIIILLSISYAFCMIILYTVGELLAIPSLSFAISTYIHTCSTVDNSWWNGQCITNMLTGHALYVLSVLLGIGVHGVLYNIRSSYMIMCHGYNNNSVCSRSAAVTSHFPCFPMWPPCCHFRPCLSSLTMHACTM